MTKAAGWTDVDVVGQLGALRRYARSLTRDEAAVEDLVHEALVRAYENRAGFRSGSDLRPWLLSILHNSFVGFWRSRKAEQNRLDHLSELVQRHNPGLGPEATVRLGQIYRAFSALPDEQRAALHLVSVEGLSYQEAAAVLDVPLGTLMSRLGRARATLREFEGSTSAEPEARSTPAIGRQRHLRVVGGARDGSR